jgi:single-strand DNA-binding protein
MSFRKITLLGNVGKDPEIKTLSSGAIVASFGIAVTDKWRDKDGAQKEKTTWFNCSVWQQGDSGLVKSVVQPYVKKGSMLFIDGTPEIQEYEKDGQKMRAFNVRIGGPGTTLRLCGQPGGKNGGSSEASAPAGAPDNNDDIPF